MGFDADVMQLAMMLQEMKNEDVRKVAIEQVKVLARLNKDAQVKKIKKEFTFSLLNHIIKAQKISDLGQVFLL